MRNNGEQDDVWQLLGRQALTDFGVLQDLTRQDLTGKLVGLKMGDAIRIVKAVASHFARRA